MFQGHARSLSLSIVLTLMGPICAGAAMQPEIAALESKISAVTGVGSCGKGLL